MDVFKASDKMRDMVRDNSALIPILGRFDISLGFADKSVHEVCKAAGVDENTFLQVVNCCCSDKDCDPKAISLSSLMRYLRNAHEYFLEFNLPTIRRRLLEAVDCSGEDGIGMLILRFYDEYVNEVRRHMEYENNVVFVYVENLLKGMLNHEYCIESFEGSHSPIGNKLRELKDVMIRYYPKKNSYRLSEVLQNIISCEEDIRSHCEVEDRLFVPAVRLAEDALLDSGNAGFSDPDFEEDDDARKGESLSEREKEVITCVARGLSNKEIADRLCLSVHTVATHRRNISGKLQIHSTAGLIIYAIANKLVDLKDIEENLSRY